MLPLLFLPLNGTLEGRDRNGTFTASGTDITFVEGYNGQIGASISGDARIDFPATGRILEAAGEMVMRAKWGATDGTAYLWGMDGTNRRFLRRATTATGAFGINGATRATSSGALAQDTFYTFSLAWDSGTARAYINGVQVGADLTYTPGAELDGNFTTATTSFAMNGINHGLMVFDAPLTTDERAATVAADAWTWDMFEDAAASTATLSRVSIGLGLGL